MRLNKEALNKVLYDEYEGNYSRFSRELGLDVAYVYRVLVKDRNCGTKFFSNVMKWCNEKGRDFNEFIFLP